VKSGFLSWFSGAKLLKNNFKSTMDIVKRARPSYEETKIDDFESVLNSLNLKSEEDKINHLLKVYSNLRLSFFLSAFIFVLFTLFLLVPSILSMSYFSLFTTTLILILISLMSINYSVRCYQIRKRNLLPLSDWVKNKSQWFPKKINKDSLKLPV